MPFESISNRRLYRQIARQIIDLIEAGEYKPGERLPAERILAERLAVSRPSVREALLALEVENRVEIRGGSGVFVLERPESTGYFANGAHPDPLELLFVRTLIEPDVAALAANNASPIHLATLAKALGNMVCCSSDDSRRLEYDREFHLSLADACGNNALLVAMRALLMSHERPVDPCQEPPIDTEQVWRCSIIEHREILEAIKRGDAKAARLSMHRHLENTRMRIASNERESGQPTPMAETLKQRVGTYPAIIELDSWTTQPARSACR